MDDFSDYAGPEWVAPFFVELRTCRNAAQAAARVGRARSTAYGRRSDPRFKRAWDECMEGGGVPAGGAMPPANAMRHNSGNKRKRFLDALIATSNVSQAAKTAAIDLTRLYRWRRSDPGFAAQWRAALAEGYEHLEMEVLAYLRGTDPERKLDVPNAIRLLAAHRKTVAEIRAFQEPEDEQAVLASIDDLIDRMRREAAANGKGGRDDQQN